MAGSVREPMIASKNCDFCEKSIPTGSALCPYCGRPQKTDAEWSSYYRSLVLGLLLMIAIFVGWGKLVGFAPFPHP
jgi:hypothetical protein